MAMLHLLRLSHSLLVLLSLLVVVVPSHHHVGSTFVSRVAVDRLTVAAEERSSRREGQRGVRRGEARGRGDSKATRAESARCNAMRYNAMQSVCSLCIISPDRIQQLAAHDSRRGVSDAEGKGKERAERSECEMRR